MRKKILKLAIEKKLSIKQIQEFIDQNRQDSSKNADSILRDRVRFALSKATSPRLLKDPKIRKKVENIAKQLEELIAKVDSDS